MTLSVVSDVINGEVSKIMTRRPRRLRGAVVERQQDTAPVSRKRRTTRKLAPVVELAAPAVELAAPVAVVELAAPVVELVAPAGELGFVDQIRITCAKQHRLAAIIGAAFGALVPGLAFHAVHFDLQAPIMIAGWQVPVWVTLLRILGTLVYSATKVVQCGKQLFGSYPLAISFAVAVELGMLGSSSVYVQVLVLLYLCFVNAVMTATKAAQRSRAWRAQ